MVCTGGKREEKTQCGLEGLHTIRKQERFWTTRPWQKVEPRAFMTKSENKVGPPQVAAEECADETGNTAATPSVCVESRDGLVKEHKWPTLVRAISCLVQDHCFHFQKVFYLSESQLRILWEHRSSSRVEGSGRRVERR